MNSKRRLFAVTLIIVMVLALGTSLASAASATARLSVRTNFGNFDLKLTDSSTESELAGKIQAQIMVQVGSKLSGQYGRKLAEAMAESIARQLAPQIKQILGSWPPAKPGPRPDTGTGPKPEPKPEPDPKPQPEIPEAEKAELTPPEAELLELVNRERVQRGLNPLQADLKVTAEARKKSRDMIVNNYFGHTSPTYGPPFDQLRRAGIGFRAAGENLAGAMTVERAHNALMNSTGHRENILNPIYTHVGIGIVEGGPYGRMFTQMFIQK